MPKQDFSIFFLKVDKMYKTASIEEVWSYLSVRLEPTCNGLDLDPLSVWLQDIYFIIKIKFLSLKKESTGDNFMSSQNTLKQISIDVMSD